MRIEGLGTVWYRMVGGWFEWAVAGGGSMVPRFDAGVEGGVQRGRGVSASGGVTRQRAGLVGAACVGGWMSMVSQGLCVCVCGGGGLHL